MKKIGDVTSTADKNGEWTNGNVAAGIPPTILESGWLNSVQREILNVLKKADVPQNKEKDDQLADAIGKIISNGKFASQESVDGKLTKDQNGADIQDKPKFIENLGLGEAAKSGLKQTTGTSKTDVMSQDGVTKAFALSEYFRLLTGEYAAIYTPNKTFRMVIFNSGAFGVYQEENKSPLIAFDSTGKMTTGDIPTSKLSGLSQSIGVSITGVPSEKAVNDALFGVGQKYVNLKAQRAVGTTYTNSSKKAIFLSVKLQGNAPKTPQVTDIFVDGSIVSSFTNPGYTDSSTGLSTQGAVAIIPQGAEYYVASSQGGTTVLEWKEMRA